MKRAKPSAAELREEAEHLAIAAVAFLAERPDDLQRFLAVTGADPDTLRTQATEPGFLAGVLEYILSDEPLVVAFAADAAIPPERVGEAFHILEAGR